jgi:hypothetical protein
VKQIDWQAVGDRVFVYTIFAFALWVAMCLVTIFIYPLAWVYLHMPYFMVCHK